MSDYIHLTGTEAVERAGRNMAGAAEDFGRHVSYLGEHLSGFLVRFEELVERMEAAAAPARIEHSGEPAATLEAETEGR